MSLSHDNGQSMVIYHSCMKHAPSVIIVSRERSEHGDISLMFETCSVSCHRHDNVPSEHDNISLRYESCSVSCHRLMITSEHGYTRVIFYVRRIGLYLYKYKIYRTIIYIYIKRSSFYLSTDINFTSLALSLVKIYSFEKA